MRIPILLLLLTFTTTHPKDIYIIIHGTWATPYAWHMPGGDFHDTLAQSVAHPQNHVSFFLWSGKNNHKKRLDAAEMLAEIIKELAVEQDNTISIIAHSHGANVGILATHLLAQDPENPIKIDRFFALGVPVCSKTYMPDMNVINHFYNMFSYSDLIQPVLGIYGREFPAHERIANIRILIDGLEPIHSQLHSTTIAKWLPKIHHTLKRFNYGNFKNFDFNKPGIIEFRHDGFPLYSIDMTRQKYRAQDEIKMRALESIMRTRYHSTEFSSFLTKRSSMPLMNL